MPCPRCMARLGSDLKEHQVDPKLAQKMEELRKAIITIYPGRDALRAGISKIGEGAACLCNMFMTTQEHWPIYRLCSGREDAAETAMHQWSAERAGGLPNRICKRV